MARKSFLDWRRGNRRRLVSGSVDSSELRVKTSLSLQKRATADTLASSSFHRSILRFRLVAVHVEPVDRGRPCSNMPHVSISTRVSFARKQMASFEL